MSPIVSRGARLVARRLPGTLDAASKGLAGASEAIYSQAPRVLGSAVSGLSRGEMGDRLEETRGVADAVSADPQGSVGRIVSHLGADPSQMTGLQELAATAVRGAQFLSRNLPRPSPDRPFSPSYGDLVRSERLITAVVEPQELRPRFEKGLVTREEADAVRQVHPGLAERLKAQLRPLAESGNAGARRSLRLLEGSGTEARELEVLQPQPEPPSGGKAPRAPKRARNLMGEFAPMTSLLEARHRDD